MSSRSMRVAAARSELNGRQAVPGRPRRAVPTKCPRSNTRDGYTVIAQQEGGDLFGVDPVK
jgi:hypothetical protein